MSAPDCPRCGEPLVVGDGVFTCSRDCGDWVDGPEAEAGRPVLAKLGLELGVTEDRAPRLPCARCTKPMEPRRWGSVAFDRCTEHGIWIDATFRVARNEDPSQVRETERAIAELEARLAVPSGRRELALRLVALDQRCYRLEQEIKRLDQRLTRVRLERMDIP